MASRQGYLPALVHREERMRLMGLGRCGSVVVTVALLCVPSRAQTTTLVSLSSADLQGKAAGGEIKKAPERSQDSAAITPA